MGTEVLFANNAATTLAAGITDVATSCTLQTGQGAEFPNPGANQAFYATLEDSSGNIEVVLVTARSTDTITMTRAQDGTSARAWLSGDMFELRNPKVVMESFWQTGTNRTANTLLAGPTTGAAASPTFRAMVVADLPSTVYGTQSANYVYAGPTSGGATAPGFRALVAADIPSTAAAFANAMGIISAPFSSL